MRWLFCVVLCVGFASGARAQDESDEQPVGMVDKYTALAKQYYRDAKENVEKKAEAAKAAMLKAYGTFINAAKEVRAKSELRGMAKVLKLDMITGEPAPRDFPKYLRENMENDEDVTKDPWGTLYELVQDGNGATSVRSCGVDKRCGTPDDLTSFVFRKPGSSR